MLFGPQELSQTFLRYLPAIMHTNKRISLRKLLNAIRAEIERRMNIVKIKSHPFVLHIELTNVCNLRCPYCITGNNESHQPKGFLSFEQFKKIIDELKDYLILIRLDGLGESLLNKDFIKMLGYASENKIITAVSTNFVSIKANEIEELIEHGLDYIIIGVDGGTEEVYSKVRPGGKFETVIENIKLLVNLKKMRKSKTPYIETQFISFSENYHETEHAKNLCESLGVNRHSIKDLREMPNNLIINKKNKKKPCYWLWYVVNINWEGKLKACCLAGLDSDFSFGNIIEYHSGIEWNNKNMINIRSLFNTEDEAITNQLEGCICLDCYKLTGLN